LGYSHSEKQINKNEKTFYVSQDFGPRSKTIRFHLHFSLLIVV